MRAGSKQHADSSDHDALMPRANSLQIDHDASLSPKFVNRAFDFSCKPVLETPRTPQIFLRNQLPRLREANPERDQAGETDNSGSEAPGLRQSHNGSASRIGSQNRERRQSKEERNA
jgi:hypothetical protein